jgi:hypothetical protein
MAELRRPGRPPLDTKATNPSADVHLTLPASTYDRVDRHAKVRRESIQEVIRRSLARLLDDERGF